MARCRDSPVRSPGKQHTNRYADSLRGTNAYWLPFLQDLADVDVAFEQMSAAGLKVTRVWGFNDTNYDTGSETVFFQLFNKTGSYPNFAPNGKSHLVDAARDTPVES